MLASPSVGQGSTRPAFTPARRGGGGDLRVLWWQAPTILNPHLSLGVKDADAARIFYEPLAAYDPAGNLFPVLAEEVPSLQNGGVARDGLSVTWKLKRGVTWHDGKPFTAADVVFNWEYVADPATAATTAGSYKGIARIDALDAHTVKIVFTQPTPFWPICFCGAKGEIIPKHIFSSFKGTRSREATANLKPIGTGPYRLVTFKPGDELRAEINRDYHVPNWPFFDRLEMKGGGDAVSAARAVLQTGEYDFAWNLQVEDDILLRMEKGGRGRVDISPTGGIEHILLNQTDPWTEVEGERSSLEAPHPFLTDPAVRSALNLLVDRAAIQAQLYGRLGRTTANYLNAPAQYESKHTRWEFSVERASQILESAGWKRGADGVRVKDGRRLKLLFQTSTNSARQRTQAIVKQAATRAGIEMELKSVVASVYFSSDAANPDTLSHFYADLQMHTWTSGAPDPQGLMDMFVSWEVATKENKWTGRNVTRWRNDAYDRLFKAAQTEMDPIRRASMFIRMNDLLIQNVVVIPVLWRSVVSGLSNSLRGPGISGWDSSLFWNLAHWYREV
jgi:peptide/nickel transport system substrate-binding protein